MRRPRPSRKGVGGAFSCAGPGGGSQAVTVIQSPSMAAFRGARGLRAGPVMTLPSDPLKVEP